VAQGAETPALPFNSLEQLCSKTASLVCGAVYADPDAFGASAEMDPDARQEATVIARRTADAFKASLADRKHAILAWPWDHIATRAAWLGTQSGHLSEDDLGRQLESLTRTYALLYREQLTAVLNLWGNVAAAVTGSAQAPDLALMGGQMYRAFQEIAA
jgi:hypothetical protein